LSSATAVVAPPFELASNEKDVAVGEAVVFYISIFNGEIISIYRTNATTYSKSQGQMPLSFYSGDVTSQRYNGCNFDRTLFSRCKIIWVKLRTATIIKLPTIHQ